MSDESDNRMSDNEIGIDNLFAIFIVIFVKNSKKILKLLYNGTLLSYKTKMKILYIFI